MHSLCSFGMLLGRFCISVIFILAGIGKFLDYDGTAAYMASKGMTMIPFFLLAAATVELIGGLSVLLGWKARWGATILLLFLIPTTVIFHDFWHLANPVERQLMMILFLKNLAIFGGLLYVICCGPGSWAVDRCSKCENKS